MVFYFIFINGIFKWISLWLAYKNTDDLDAFGLGSCDLTSLISFIGPFVDSDFLCRKSHCLWIKTVLPLYLYSLYLFFLLLSVALAWTSNKILKRRMCYSININLINVFGSIIKTFSNFLNFWHSINFIVRDVKSPAVSVLCLVLRLCLVSIHWEFHVFLMNGSFCRYEIPLFMSGNILFLKFFSCLLLARWMFLPSFYFRLSVWHCIQGPFLEAAYSWVLLFFLTFLLK